MRILSDAELKTLAQDHEGPCISIFMPTHRGGAGTQQDRIRLKNLLAEAEDSLIDGWLRRSEARSLLEPARELLENEVFWQHQSDSLAVFVSQDAFHYYQMPFKLEELLIVGQKFHLKPLLPLLSGDGRFYVLALSQNEVRLLQGTRDSIDEVALEDVPDSLSDALSYDDIEKRLQFRTQSRGEGGRRGHVAVFHGHGAGPDFAKNNILRFFHLVDEGISKLFGGERSPLVLAGVDYLHPIYREANTYTHLLDEGIEGNPQYLSARELHEEAWGIVRPIFRASQRDALAKYEELEGTGLTSGDVSKIVVAAHNGRVKTLFVALGQQQFGLFDVETGAVWLRDDSQPSSDDLLDLAAIQTLLNGGAVYAVEPEEVPGGTLLAAVFRY
jgi:hypothetical protein